MPLCRIQRSTRNANDTASRVAQRLDGQVEVVRLAITGQLDVFPNANARLQNAQLDRAEAFGVCKREKVCIRLAKSVCVVERWPWVVQPRVAKVTVLAKDHDRRVHQRYAKALFAVPQSSLSGLALRNIPLGR